MGGNLCVASELLLGAISAQLHIRQSNWNNGGHSNPGFGVLLSACSVHSVVYCHLSVARCATSHSVQLELIQLQSHNYAQFHCLSPSADIAGLANFR